MSNTQAVTTTADMSALAHAAVEADKRANSAKGKATMLCFASLYLAQQEERFANLQLHRVPYMAKTEKGATYDVIWSGVFGQDDSNPLGSTFKDKLKLSFDVLAYVAEMEKRAGKALIRVQGDKVSANCLLLQPDDETQDAWLSLDKSAKYHTSVTELRRAARKHADLMSEPLPANSGDKVGRKGSTDDKPDTGTVIKELNLSDFVKLASARLSRLTCNTDGTVGNGRMDSELREEMQTLHSIVTAVLEHNKPRNARAVKEAA